MDRFLPFLHPSFSLKFRPSPDPRRTLIEPSPTLARVSEIVPKTLARPSPNPGRALARVQLLATATLTEPSPRAQILASATLARVPSSVSNPDPHPGSEFYSLKPIKQRLCSA